MNHNPVRQLLSSYSRPVVAQLTPYGRGAICVLAVYCHDHPNPLDQFFVAANGRPISQQAEQRPIYGTWRHEDIIVCLLDHQHFEIHCHGGSQASQRIICDLGRAGFADTDLETASAQSPEITAMLMMPAATTLKTAAILNWQVNGAWTRARKEIEEMIVVAPQKAATKILDIRKFVTLGQHLVCPWRVAVTGEPNVGKSSLVNRLSGFERAIVQDQPGTTRDPVTEQVAFNGWPVTLTDTAGIRDSQDPIEQEGIRLTHLAVGKADLIIHLLDATRHGLDCRRSAPNQLIVINKCDLIDNPRAEHELPEDAICISAQTGSGLESLTDAVTRHLVPEEPKQDSPVPLTESQVAWLDAMLEKC